MKKIIIILICFSLCACKETTHITKESATYFDTLISISLYDKEKPEVINKCFKECERLQNIFSRTDVHSELYQLNHRKTNQVKISKELAFLIQKGLEYYQISEYRFDITIAPLIELWDFKSDKHVIPTLSQLHKCLKKVDASSLHLNQQIISFDHQETQIDLGAIVKGYAADRLKKILLKEDIHSAIINLGGNVLVIGEKPNHTKFKVGIQKPFSPTGESLLVEEVKDKSIVSSGIYERYFKKNNTIYHHILDNKTGYPVKNHLYQVTIISNQSLEGDLLSTVTFLLGKEKGMKYIESLKEVEAIFVDDHYNIYKTSGLK